MSDNFTTTAELDALPVGRRFTDRSTGNNRAWSVVNPGSFEWNGVRVSSRDFTAALAAGFVSQYQPPILTAETEWQTEDGSANEYYLYVTKVHDSGNADIVAINSGGNVLAFHADQRPDYMSGYTLNARVRGTNQLIRDTARFMSAALGVRQGLQPAIHTYLDEHSYPENSDLERLLTEYGIEARYADVEVTVEVTGTVIQQVEVGSMGVSVEGAEVVGTVNVDVPFVATKTITVKSPGCGCTRLTEAQVHEALGFAPTTMSYSASCPLDEALVGAGQDKDKK